MPRLLKEPLVHFLIGGLALYLALEAFTPPAPPTADVITLDEAALATYLQFRAKSFDAAAARQQLAGMDADTRAALEAEYVDAEVLYREALSLGLDAGDDIIRKRLIQKMDFMLQGFEEDMAEPSAAELAAFYNAHPDSYRREARLSFTHVYLKAGDQAQAASLLEVLEGVSPEASGRHGDRFPYLRTYANRPARLIAEHFGTEMANALQAEAPVGRWSGPYRSPLGQHLVFVHSRTAAELPPLEEVATAVRADLMRQRRALNRADAIARLRGKYRIERPGQ